CGFSCCRMSYSHPIPPSPSPPSSVPGPPSKPEPKRPPESSKSRSRLSTPSLWRPSPSSRPQLSTRSNSGGKPTALPSTLISTSTDTTTPFWPPLSSPTSSTNTARIPTATPAQSQNLKTPFVWPSPASSPIFPGHVPARSLPRSSWRRTSTTSAHSRASGSPHSSTTKTGFLPNSSRTSTGPPTSDRPL